jgi:hypothetical protein
VGKCGKWEGGLGQIKLELPSYVVHIISFKIEDLHYTTYIVKFTKR